MTNIVEFVSTQEELFVPAIADNAVEWTQEKQFAIQALQADDYLSKIALGNQTSLQNAIINVASIGISLNPASKHAYLVPRDGKVCLDVSYMGLLHLAMSSGSIMWGQCKLVHANDSYISNGLDKAPEHKYSPFGDRGEVVGAYCTVKTSTGDYLTEEMPINEIMEIGKASKSYNSKYSPWKSHPREMYRKTVVKRASKYWPTVDRLDKAIHHLNTDSGEGLASVEPVDISPIDKEQVKLLEQGCKDKGKTVEDLAAYSSALLKREITDLTQILKSEFDRVYKAVKA